MLLNSPLSQVFRLVSAGGARGAKPSREATRLPPGQKAPLHTCCEFGSQLMIELRPLLVRVPIRRWQNITGRDAISLDTSRRFNAIAQPLLIVASETADGR
jgi:hypothetical protein